jgi:Plasmid recombination enzyme
MPYAICRIQKLKSFNAITLSGKHTDRTQETPNSNPQIENIELVPNTINRQIGDIVREKIGDIKHRKDAILCTEYFLGASPEYFRPDHPEQAGYYDDNILQPWIETNLKWLKDKHGDNLVKATVHLDEVTPHIAAYIVPIHDDPREPGKKKLSYNVDFGGSKYRLQQLQDEYAKAMAHLGLERGVKGSTAKHQDTNRYYAQVNASIEQQRQAEAQKLAEQHSLEEQRRQVEEERRQMEAEKRQWWAEQIAPHAVELLIRSERRNLTTRDGYSIDVNPTTKTINVSKGDVIVIQQGKVVQATKHLQKEHFDDWQRRRLQELDQMRSRQGQKRDGQEING